MSVDKAVIGAVLSLQVLTVDIERNDGAVGCRFFFAKFSFEGDSGRGLGRIGVVKFGWNRQRKLLDFGEPAISAIFNVTSFGFLIYTVDH